MSALVTVKPFKLQPNFGIEHLQAFLTYCTEYKISELVFQTGDLVWGEVNGHQIALTTRTIKDGEIKALLGLAFGNEIIGIIKSGNDADRPYRFVLNQNTQQVMQRYRVNISGAQIGEAEDGLSMTMRMIPEVPPPLASLSLPSDILHHLFQPRGLVLICGPTGSGKTTLMSAFYAFMSETERNVKILLYEDPIEFLFTKLKPIGPKIRQMQIGRHISSFAYGIRNAMRCKPTLIGIGEARDAPTISAMVEAALTGHGTYGTLHTESVSETINRAVQAFPVEQHTAIASKILGALRLVIVQMLVPTLDGKRIAVREWLYFNHKIKHQMGELPCAQWGTFLRKAVAEKKQDLITGMRDLLDRGLIEKRVFHRYIGESNQ